jgi:hypothetical protein
MIANQQAAKWQIRDGAQRGNTLPLFAPIRAIRGKEHTRYCTRRASLRGRPFFSPANHANDRESASGEVADKGWRATWQDTPFIRADSRHSRGKKARA